jgi:pimeloyl-ACP methyl ester carboxylesterase
MPMARTIRYKFEGTEVSLGMDEAGSGRSVVLLPALSSISTREEMRSLFDNLAPAFRVSTVDWPGFGNLARPRANWTPDLLSRFLHWFLREIVRPPHTIVAAGHAATYALWQAAHQPGEIERLVLIAPTWRGPLPTMMGGSHLWFDQIRKAVDLPALGPALYRINVSRPVITKMAREHVYSDPAWLTPNRLAAKLAVTGAPGARHASVRFVSGALDRVDSRKAFLELARSANVPILVLYGAQTPRKSRLEMEALAELSNVQVERLATGKLSVHEEYPDAVASAIVPFLSQ